MTKHSLSAKRYELTSSQKLMVFVLSMSLYGISNMITELLPELQIGPIELKVEYFMFIPLTLAVLFHPLYAAIGASFGEVIFGELLLGQFGGLGELEKFIQFSLGVYIAGMLVNNPLNRKQLAIAAYVAIGIDQLLGTIVDIGKVYVGIEELSGARSAGIDHSDRRLCVSERDDHIGNAIFLATNLVSSAEAVR